MNFDTLITTDALLDSINQPNWVIIDCRFSLGAPNAGRESYRAGHIPGAHYADLDVDLSSEVLPGQTGRHPLPNIVDLEKKLSAWGIDNHSQVIVYDDKGGAIAARLWWLLNWLGHEKVAVLDGGWQYWLKKGHPVTTILPLLLPKEFTPNIQHQMTVSKKEIGIQTGEKMPPLVDSRAYERYLGKIEPIDPIAGHIPGAINLPFIENLNSNGRFLSKEALQNRFSSIKNEPDLPIFYCGSGVTACHNILAYKYCGLGQARLYPGSWSEWIIGY